MTASPTDSTVWQRLAAPVPPAAIQWRADGKPVTRGSETVVRQVAYIDAQLVRARLDEVVPGAWALTLDVLPALEDEGERLYAFKARLQVLGVVREDVGTGRDYKAAASDAFKRAAVRFGVGHELYAMESRWVPADRADRTPTAASRAAMPDPQGATDTPSCPKCGGRMWDNRLTKRNPKAPDFKCRDRTCDGVVWPARAAAGDMSPDDELPPPLGSDDIPF